MHSPRLFPDHDKSKRGEVPSKKPTYAPAGCHRCQICNGIVRDGAECGCIERRRADRRQDRRKQEASADWKYDVRTYYRGNK